MISPGTYSDTAVIIVAAGRGSRFGGDRPKQFADVGGRPLLLLTVSRLRAAMPGASMVIALPAEHLDFWENLKSQYPHLDFSGISTVAGGATRWESVKHALSAVGADVRVVMVHDAARPLVDKDVADRLLRALRSGARGVVPVVAVCDSLRQLCPDRQSTHSVDRSQFVAVQTPQAFHRDVLAEAYLQPYSPEFTDDASVVEALWPESIATVEGSRNTLKVTHPADIALIRHILDNEH